MKIDDAAMLVIGASFSKHHVFNQAQVRAFATAAGDTNPLHHDEAAAGRSRFGRLIVSGTQSTALLLGLAAAHFSENFSVVGIKFTVEFLGPIYADATIKLEWKIVSVSSNGSRSRRVELLGAIYDEQGKLHLRATGLVSVFSAPCAAANA